MPGSTPNRPPSPELYDAARRLTLLGGAVREALSLLRLGRTQEAADVLGAVEPALAVSSWR